MPTQLFLFPAAPPRYQPKIEHVRNRMDSLLEEARAAETMPWSEACLALYRKVMRDLARYLPQDEGANYGRAFEAELIRLGAPAED